jgi:thiopeptide-type bacteriocin biosynthesis protein
MPIDLLAAANIIDIAQALDPDGWRAWLLETYPKNRMHTAFQQLRTSALEVLDVDGEWAGLRALPGGEELLERWRSRTPQVMKFGRFIRQQNSADSRSAVFASLVHMHHNRLVGIDPVSEASAYSIARGSVQAILDRERHLKR